MQNRTTNIKQHYIPQYYLRQFTDSNDKFYVYDNILDKSYKTSPAKENYGRFFYDVEPSLMSKFIAHDKLHHEFIDDHIRQLNENVVSKIFKTFDELNELSFIKNGYQFVRKSRENLVDFIILQMIRTPQYRDEIKYLGVPFFMNNPIDNFASMRDADAYKIIHNIFTYGALCICNIDKDLKLKDEYFQIFEHLLLKFENIKKQLLNSGKCF